MASVGTLLIASTGLSAGTIFTITYMSGFPWWRTWEGRSLATSSVGVLVLLLAVLLGVGHVHAVWPISLALLSLGETFKLVILYRALNTNP